MSQKFCEAKSAQGGNRTSYAFLVGLVATASLAVGTDGWGRVMQQASYAELPAVEQSPATEQRALGAQDWQAAATAWSYFETHFRPETGFVDAVADHPNATLWDQGSHVMALMAARGLGLLDAETYASRCEALVSGLERLPLFEGRLPNKAYDTRTLAMVDYANRPQPEGIGFSALDVARLLMGLRLLEMRSPEFAPRIRALVLSWDLEAMTAEGRLWGSSRTDGVTLYHQEGRIGYEQYGARAAALWGLDVLDASTARAILTWEKVSGVKIAADRRRAQDFGAITPVVSEPYLLQALEIGLNEEGWILADRLYRAQKNRTESTGRLTIVSEDHIDQAPHFLYGSVFGNGTDWAVLSEDGEDHQDLRTVSLKAAFGWDALYGSAFTSEAVSSLADLAGEKGWYAGRYETDGRINTALTLNTNAVVLESLHYRLKGPLLHARQ